MVTWNDIKIADAGFLINLKEREDRLSESLLEFNKLNIKGVERFDAIKISENSNYGWIIRGCTQSHCDILKYQFENKLDKIIIFEDDFMFDVASNEDYILDNNVIHNFSKIDFDVLFLGSCLTSPSEMISENTIRPNKFVQTTCYISTYKFSEYVVKNFDYLNNSSLAYGEAIDSYYSLLSSKDHWLNGTGRFDESIIDNNDLKIRFHYPILFTQRPSFSNITNRETNIVSFNKFKNLENYPK